MQENPKPLNWQIQEDRTVPIPSWSLSLIEPGMLEFLVKEGIITGLKEPD